VVLLCGPNNHDCNRNNIFSFNYIPYINKLHGYKNVGGFGKGGHEVHIECLRFPELFKAPQDHIDWFCPVCGDDDEVNPSLVRLDEYLNRHAIAKELANINSTEKYMTWLTYLQSTWDFNGWLENDLIYDFNKTNFTPSEFNCDKDDLIGSEICLFIQPSFEIKRNDCGNMR